jgi:hypothetical protein
MDKITAIFRYILIFIFTTTLLNKLLDYQAFKHQLFLSPLIPPDFSAGIAFITILFEAIILICLLVNRLNFYGLLLSSFLLSLFGFYLLFLVVNFKFNKPCGCGFMFSFLNYSQHIGLNFFLSIIAALLVIFNSKFTSVFTYNSVKE